ncbi:MAG: AI-2E family transporter [Spirochaetes bacterium]|nr:AI-2E family transporter [Spirochaetota bacterium]
MPTGLNRRKTDSTIVMRTGVRRQTRRLVFSITAIVVIITLGVLIWSLRPIFLPIIIGMLAAYICAPLLKLFMRMKVPRAAGILLLFGVFVLTGIIIANQIGSIIPGERDRLVLQTRFQYKLNEKYRSLMGLDTPEGSGNIVYRYFGPDFDRFMRSINSFLSLSDEESALFIKYREGYRGQPLIEDAYYRYFLKNRDADISRAMDRGAEKERRPLAPEEAPGDSPFTVVMNAFQLWIIMPFVFLFLLIDDGEIRRFFVGLVPNRYFEVSLAVVDKVNKAIGNYLRGILLQCSLVGITYCVLLVLIGFELKMAILIGISAGLANAIPLLGPAIALGIGASYALIAENVNSILPFITPENLTVAIAVCVLLVMALDNGFYQPVVLGSAVKLHPLAVFIGIMGGSMLFGFAGLILAIPTIVVIKEMVYTLFRELKEYYII